MDRRSSVAGGANSFERGLSQAAAVTQARVPWNGPLPLVLPTRCTAIVEIVRKLRLIFGVRRSPVAATSARFEVRDYFHTSSRPTFLRPRTGALRLVAASPRRGRGRPHPC